jgi:hypothetical protein
MVCQTVTLPGGATAIVCGPRQKRKRCVKCRGPADLLCDWKTPTEKRPRKTCDRPICAGCSTSPAPDKDLCPDHAVAFEEWKARR